MSNINVIVALMTRDNDYQAEQATAVAALASSLGVKIEIIYADNDAVNQTQQIIKIIQNADVKPAAILVEPVGTGMPQVAKAAVAGGLGWGVIKKGPEYLPEVGGAGVLPGFLGSTHQF